MRLTYTQKTSLIQLEALQYGRTPGSSTLTLVALLGPLQPEDGSGTSAIWTYRNKFSGKVECKVTGTAAPSHEKGWRARKKSESS